VPELPAIDRLAKRISRLRLPARVAVDGVDAAGKTTLAGELAERAGAARLSADEFLRPAEERYRRGRESPEGYYLDSFDHRRLRNAVLAERGLVIVDGIFLLRPELNDLWTLRIFIHVELEESARRGIQRDGAETEPLYRRRYLPGQRIYLERVRPRELADVVVDNTDPERPVLSPDVAGGRS
jgi:uridine kinase